MPDGTVKVSNDTMRTDGEATAQALVYRPDTIINPDGSLGQDLGKLKINEADIAF